MYTYTDHFKTFFWIIIVVTKQNKTKSIQISQYAKFDFNLKHITHDSIISNTHPVKLPCREIQKQLSKKKKKRT